MIDSYFCGFRHPQHQPDSLMEGVRLWGGCNGHLFYLRCAVLSNCVSGVAGVLQNDLGSDQNPDGTAQTCQTNYSCEKAHLNLFLNSQLLSVIVEQKLFYYSCRAIVKKKN